MSGFRLQADLWYLALLSCIGKCNRNLSQYEHIWKFSSRETFTSTYIIWELRPGKFTSKRQDAKLSFKTFAHNMYIVHKHRPNIVQNSWFFSLFHFVLTSLLIQHYDGTHRYFCCLDKNIYYTIFWILWMCRQITMLQNSCRGSHFAVYQPLLFLNHCLC